MNFDLTDEQVMLRDSVLRFGQEHYDFAIWRERVSGGRGFDRANWGRMAELGWLALTVPEDDGGLGGSAADAMVIMEGIGRSLMLEPFVGACIIAPALLQHASSDRRAELMTAIIGGEVVISLADAEPGGRYSLNHVATTAEARNGGYILTGQKSHALDGAEADWFIVPARTSGGTTDEAGITLFLVAKDADGLQVSGGRAVDHRRNAQLRLDSVQVSAGDVIGPVGGGLPLLQEAVDRAIVARLAEAMGAMDACFEQTMEYLKTRKQFGKTIGSFQALQHRAVDMAIACEEARSMTYLATMALDGDTAERRRIVSSAKARVGQTSLYVGRQGVQLHGGIGFSDELPISHYLKRMTMIDMAYGNADHHRSIVAGLTRAAA
jgi:alkylation response protein AidB-like acyl-CoA dehydrogenase